MRHFFWIATTLLAAASANAETAEDIANRYPGYKLAFQDEFNTGTRPDTKVWSFETGYKRNNEAQYYQQDNATIADGCLVIEARKNDNGHDYTSSSLIAKDPYRFNMGIYEVRAKIPVGTGYWPAIWSTGSVYEWPYNGEIDVMEYYGDALHANVAWGTTTRWNAAWNSRAPRMSNFAPDFADNFHIWRLEWTYESIKIYCDDELLNDVNLDQTVNGNPKQSWFNVDNYNPYRDPAQLHGVWLNLALGGNNGGSLTNTPFPAHYYVDYVRVYTPIGSVLDPLTRKITEAKKLLDSTTEGTTIGCYPTEARTALSEAIAEAERVTDDVDEAAVAAAVETLQQAIDAYRASVVPLKNYSEFRLTESATGKVLSSGFVGDVHGMYLYGDKSVDPDAANFNQTFIFEATSPDAAAQGYNIKTPEGYYVYCSGSWELRLSDTPDLNAATHIFDLAIEGDYALITNRYNNKYFGYDTPRNGMIVYSDKVEGGKGTRCLFTIEDLTPESSLSTLPVTTDRAIYNLQGIRIADSTEPGIYIVVANGKATKILR